VHLVPLDPRIDLTTPPLSQVAAIDAGTFFGNLAGLLLDNAPRPDDAAMVATLARIGVVSGQPFDFRGLALPLRGALDRAVVAAHRLIQARGRAAGAGGGPASRPTHRSAVGRTTSSARPRPPPCSRLLRFRRFGRSDLIQLEQSIERRL
jgi:hypothetical protein